MILRESQPAAIAFCACTVALIFILFQTNGTYGGGDSYVHYRFAKWCWVYPHLLLDHWSKPVFTLIASPFAQFGFYGIKAFNGICGLITALLGYRLIQLLGFKFSWLAIPTILFTPIYLAVLFSGLTESLFALTLVAGTYLWFRKKYHWFAFILSFLFLIRTEGIFIQAAFAAILLIRKQYLPFILIGSGGVIYSMIGGVYFGDILWLWNKLPYRGENYYGTGWILHYIGGLGRLMSPYNLIGGGLAVIGLTRLSILKNRHQHMSDILIAIVMPMIIFVFFHTLSWWTGIGGSAGLLRIMAGIAPHFAIMGVIGFNLTFHQLRLHWAAQIVGLMCVYSLVTFTNEIMDIPKGLDSHEETMKLATDLVKDRNLATNRLWYNSPFLLYELNKDPYNLAESVELFWHIRSIEPENGDIIIIQANPQIEDQMAFINTYLQNPKLIKLHSFESPDGNMPLEVFVLQCNG